jgi:hypothetical protein
LGYRTLNQAGMIIKNKFRIEYGKYALDQVDWLTGPAENIETPESILIKYAPTTSQLNKSIFSNQDFVIGGIFLLLTILSAFFLYKVSSALFSGTATGDEKKIVYVMIFFIVIGLLLTKHFFTKKPELTFANVETASIFLSKDYVKYDLKYSDYEKSWEEPVKNYKSINIHRETMSVLDTGSSLPLSQSHVHFDVIYLVHKSEEDKTLALQALTLDQNATDVAIRYSKFLNIEMSQ